MNDTDKKYEAIIADLGLPGPRVTLAMVEEILATVDYDARVLQGTTKTIAAAILPSGFVLATAVTGPASSENFNPALGIEMAISKARDLAREAIWQHEGYRLQQALYEARQGTASAALQQIRAVLRPPVPAPMPVAEWAAQHKRLPGDGPVIEINVDGRLPAGNVYERLAEAFESEVKDLTGAGSQDAGASK